MDSIGLREYRERAAELIESGQPQAALRIVQQILHSFPHSLHGHCLLGRALLGLGRLDEAARQFDWVLAADPENAEACLGLAIVYQKLGDQQRAIEQLQRAFDLFPADNALRERLNAVAEVLMPTSAHAALELSRMALARIYARNGLRAKAIQELQAILTQQPQRHDARLALVEALWQEGLRQEAVEESQRILAVFPNTLKANWIVAAAWLEKSQPEAAQPYLARAQALDPEHEVASALLDFHLLRPPEHPTPEELEGGTYRLSQTAEPAPAGASAPGIRDLTEVCEKEATVMSEQSPSEESFEIPDWLKDLGDEILSEEPAAPEPIAAPEPASSDVQAELPDWLQALIARAEAGGAEQGTAGGAETELPPWLTEISSEDVGASAPVEVSPISATRELTWQSEAAQTSEELSSLDTEAELPEWLREIQRGTRPAHAEAAVQTPEAAPSQLPEWLRDETVADEVAPVQMDELPEWLREEVSTAESTPSVVEPAVPLTEELPDWLREVEEPAMPAEAPLPTPSAEQTAEVAWPTEEAATAESTTLPTEAPPATLPEEEAPLPEWLQELRAAAPEPAPAPGEPEEEAQMPEWLRQLRAGIVEAPTLGTRELEEDLAKLAIVAPSEVAESETAPPPPLFPEPLPQEAPMADADLSAPLVESIPEVSGKAVEGAEEVAAVPIVEEVVPVAEVVEQVAASPVSEPSPEVPPTVEMKAEAVIELPEAPAERLALARQMALAGQWTQALTLYAALVDAAALLDSVISDLEEGIRRHPDDYHGYQLVGDAYAKGGRLAEALRAYRIALTKLQQQTG
ncbi:MAG: hypothetical protein DDG58_04905 [Ardenticatenia bacterium]|jgi:tetratricopeptide (TPR) repeat protein|nr:MAG: hypothetical protein DDG58_04905 [Ardenticatenia bacterium]